ncbi:MAG: GrpB family protein [Candidatus Pacebacteria bacterium]|jgi:GrpB-like predicted nucleotidyltransferase (UPF0157 family)|nr:GrpB family protein [Candidatus Paceibacterota bacterium]
MEQKIETVDISHLEVREYDPKWPEIFEQEAERIKSLLGDKIARIEHIGSTSITGLASKPIIDIAVEIPSSENIESVIEPLATLGYVSSKDVSTERHFLRKGVPTEFHLSICYGDKGSFLERQILFRDYLREHLEDRDAYGELKKELLQRDPTGKGEYIGGKTDFVMRILKKAGFENKWFDLSKY